MGSSRSKDFTSVFPEHRKYCLVCFFRLFLSFFDQLGLDAAGKTSMAYKMGWGEIVSTIPTIGFNVETVDLAKAQLIMWDVGGEDKIRPLWRHYMIDLTGLIWMVDANDRDRLEETSHELFLFFDESRGCLRESAQSRVKPLPVLIFLNKQDLPNAMGTVEFVEELNLEDSFRQFGVRNWTVQPCCARTGEGLADGLAWLADHTYQEGEYTPSDEDSADQSSDVSV